MRAPTGKILPPGAGGSFQREESINYKAEEETKVEELTKTVEDEEGLKEFTKTLPIPAEPEEGSKDIANFLKPEGVLNNLRKLGIELTKEDIEAYLFHGSIEKAVPVFKISDKIEFTAKIRTLSSKHYMIVEEIIGEQLAMGDMTREGLGSLRTICVLSMGVTELMGRPTIDSWGNPDADMKAQAIENKKIIMDLAPGVVNKINSIHAALTTAFNSMLEDGNSPFLINS